MGFDLDRAISSLYKGELPTHELVLSLCSLLKSRMCSESNVAVISSPVSVVGDVHGQFYDLLELFKHGNTPPDTNYLFLGDYVDRGKYSIETILLLSALNLRYPKRVYMLRGNHESRNVTQTYGFYGECLKKYKDQGVTVWKAITDMFDYLALGAVIDNSVLCVHGGLSPLIKSIDDIKNIDRFKEIPHEGAMADLVWSDPSQDIDDDDTYAVSPRGAGYTFGKSVVDQFVHVNQIDCILRAHQLCMEGYQVLFDYKLVTVWSAPNYCYRCGNLASILEIYGENFKEQHFFNIFEAAPENERKIINDQEVLDYFL